MVPNCIEYTHCHKENLLAQFLDHKYLSMLCVPSVLVFLVDTHSWTRLPLVNSAMSHSYIAIGVFQQWCLLTQCYINIIWIICCAAGALHSSSGHYIYTVLAQCIHLAQVESDTLSDFDCGYYSLNIWMGKSVCCPWNYLTWGYLSYGISTLWKVMLTATSIQQLMKQQQLSLKTSSFSQVNA